MSLRHNSKHVTLSLLPEPEKNKVLSKPTKKKFWVLIVKMIDSTTDYDSRPRAGHRNRWGDSKYGISGERNERKKVQLSLLLRHNSLQDAEASTGFLERSNSVRDYCNCFLYIISSFKFSLFKQIESSYCCLMASWWLSDCQHGPGKQDESSPMN